MNIQDEVIKIHANFGMSEKANYEIQLLCERYAKKYHEQQVKNCLIADVVKSLPTEFADWIADQDLYRYHDGWEIDGEKFDTDELYAEFLKCYPTWSANG